MDTFCSSNITRKLRERNPVVIRYRKKNKKKKTALNPRAWIGFGTNRLNADLKVWQKCCLAINNSFNLQYFNIVLFFFFRKKKVWLRFLQRFVYRVLYPWMEIWWRGTILSDLLVPSVFPLTFEFSRYSTAVSGFWFVFVLFEMFIIVDFVYFPWQGSLYFVWCVLFRV